MDSVNVQISFISILYFRVCDAVNDTMTTHIKNFVKGWNPAFNDPTVLNHALNRYFLTKKLENTALTKDKLETEKRKRASHERKKEVC